MRLVRRSFFVFAVGCLAAGPASAQFVPGGATISTTTNTAQTLSANTGTVASTGTISITSGGAVAVTMTGTSTLVNNGTIQTSGTGRAIDSNAAGSNLHITNTGLISAVSTDAFRVNTANSAVSLTNSGTIRVTSGGQAIDWAAITSATNTLINQSTGVITAVGEDAVRPGANGIVNNLGTIAATPTGGASPSGSDGIDLRTLSGIQVTNGGTIAGRHGIATDGSNVGPSTLTVTNNAGVIMGLNGSGINVDGVNTSVTANVTNLQGATIRGGVLAVATAGDGDGIDVDGVLTLTNSGDILGYGARGPNNPEGIAAGGGSITNTATGRIIGSSLTADAPNGDPTKLGSGILIDDSNGGSAVAPTTVDNAGLIEGRTGFGIKIVGTQSDTVTNSGTIIGNNGNAIDLGGGDDTLVIQGGLASIIGNIVGGTGTNTVTIDPGLGNTFSYSGAMSQFALLDVTSGFVNLSGASTFIETARVSGGNLRLGGADRLLFGSTAGLGSNIALNGGLLEFATGGIGQTFNTLSLTDNSTLDLDFSGVTFNGLGSIAAGKSLTIVDFLDPGAFRFFGDFTGDANFLALMANTTIRGASVVYAFDGVYTTLDAVPEPSTIVLVGVAVLAVMARRRRLSQIAVRS